MMVISLILNTLREYMEMKFTFDNNLPLNFAKELIII